jgi:hypothetical protein
MSGRAIDGSRIERRLRHPGHGVLSARWPAIKAPPIADGSARASFVMVLRGLPAPINASR